MDRKNLMKIMIVDDHSAMRRTLRTIIDSSSETNHEFTECEDGTDAVKQFSIVHPDLVLMDIQLKEMNGFDAAGKIYRSDAEAKIIFVTSFDSQPYRSKAQELHAHGFVSKENLSELKTIIQTLS